MYRFTTMSAEEIVDRIEAAENERKANHRKLLQNPKPISDSRRKLNDLDHEKRFRRPNSKDHDNLTC